MLRKVFIALACATVSARQAATMPPPPVDSGDSDSDALTKSSGSPLGLAAAIITAGGAAAAAATPAVRRAINTKLQALLNRDDDLMKPPASAERTPSPARADQPPPAAAQSAEADSGAAAGEEPLVLSPERLSLLAQLSPQLEPIAEQLERVPAFTVTVGNTSAPLTVKAPDGSRLAYFFLEYVDAELFRRRLMEQPQMREGGVEMQVAALALSDVVRAYSQSAAKEADEHFVLIPTMSAVSSARTLLAARGQQEAASASLSVANGLVPVFWVQALAMRTAEGKQRKILFFRESDCAAMWKNISGSSEEAAELEEPEMMFSSLQSVAAHLAATNKTDDVVFFPSNTALRLFEAGAQAQREEMLANEEGREPASPQEMFGRNVGEEEEELEV